jgi:hypothetical protein
MHKEKEERLGQPRPPLDHSCRHLASAKIYEVQTCLLSLSQGWTPMYHPGKQALVSHPSYKWIYSPLQTMALGVTGRSMVCINFINQWLLDTGSTVCVCDLLIIDMTWHADLLCSSVSEGEVAPGTPLLPLDAEMCSCSLPSKQNGTLLFCDTSLSLQRLCTSGKNFLLNPGVFLVYQYRQSTAINWGKVNCSQGERNITQNSSYLIHTSVVLCNSF